MQPQTELDHFDSFLEKCNLVRHHDYGFTLARDRSQELKERIWNSRLVFVKSDNQLLLMNDLRSSPMKKRVECRVRSFVPDDEDDLNAGLATLFPVFVGILAISSSVSENVRGDYVRNNLHINAQIID